MISLMLSNLKGREVWKCEDGTYELVGRPMSWPSDDSPLVVHSKVDCSSRLLIHDDVDVRFHVVCCHCIFVGRTETLKRRGKMS